jgi:ParB family transcriptional regulator, chromosome partitioning protein
MVEELGIKDPLQGHSLVLKVVPVEHLEAIEHQRKPRRAHVDNLVSSMQRIGFVVPVVAIEQQRDDTTMYVVIDGQHRLEAARSLGVDELPVVVVPDELARRMMSLNVEKDLNIRERAFVALGIYRSLIHGDPGLKENDPEVADSIERAYYVTLGIAYDKASRLAGSAFEPLLKKCDSFLDAPIGECLAVREERAGAVLEANELVRGVTEQAKERNLYHQYFQYQLVAYIDPYKRKRGPVDFDECFDKVIAKLNQLNGEPERIAKVLGARS